MGSGCNASTHRELGHSGCSIIRDDRQVCGSEDDKKKGVPGKTQTTEDIYSLPVSSDMKPSASQIK